VFGSSAVSSPKYGYIVICRLRIVSGAVNNKSIILYGRLISKNSGIIRY
jgi:hypothetical protein